MTQLDYDLDRHLESEEEKGECAMCGGETKQNAGYCSYSCARADER